MSQTSCVNVETTSSTIPVLFTYFLTSIIGKQCEFGNVAYPRDRTSDILDNHVNIDFIVVGSGSSGSVVASRLSEVSKWNVLLIEAGEDPSVSSNIPIVSFSMQKTSMDWSYESEKQSGVCEGLRNNVCNIPRGKALGGSSNLNMMIHLVGNSNDYDSWGSPDWSFQNIEQYFHKSFEDHYYVGYTNRSDYFKSNEVIQTLFDASKELNMEKLGYKEKNINENEVGTLHLKTAIRDGERLNTAKAFLVPVKDRQNLFVMKNTVVTKILLENKKATGVQILKNEKYYEIKFSKELVVSAGAVNTPKLLFQSGIGDGEQLKQENVEVKHHLPSVGKYLYDHPMFMLPIALNMSATTNRKRKAKEHEHEKNGVPGEFQMDNENEIKTFLSQENCNENLEGFCSVTKDKTATLKNLDTNCNDTPEKIRQLLQENKDNILKNKKNSQSPPNFDEIYNYITKKTGLLASIGVMDHVTFLDTTFKNPTEPNIILIYVYVPKGDNKTGLMTALRSLNWNETMMDPLFNDPNDLLLIFPMLLKPLSYGHITFSNNLKDKPKIFLNYFKEKEDTQVIVSAIKIVQNFIQTEAFQKYNAQVIRVLDTFCDDHYSYDSDKYWECSVKRRATSCYHLSSTCRFGNSLETSVLDDKLKVHGLDNVRIADASAMPNTVSANIHATCIMIGEKCADLIKTDWKQIE